MNIIQELIDKNDHLGILQLEGDDYDQYKTVAYIKLEKYQEAMKLSKKNTFEFCYCLYKLKKYKNCVKIVERLMKQNEKHEGLSFLYAQSLYHLGYYNKAKEIINKTNKPAALINLMASESMSLLDNDEVYRYKVKVKDEQKKIIADYDNTELTKEQKEELVFNKSFEYLMNEKKYIKYLEDNIENKLCFNQFNNVTGNYDMIDTKILGKKQKEILKYNKENDESVELEHFQKNNYEYEIFCERPEKYNFKTDNLKFLYALNLLKKKKRQNAKKVIQKTHETKIKKMLNFVLNKKEKSQKQIIDMLKNFE